MTTAIDLILVPQAYQTAIERAVERLKAAEGEVHVLDMGCGTGLFAAMAARANASSVVACDLHESMCATARKVIPASITCPQPSALYLLILTTFAGNLSLTQLSCCTVTEITDS